MAAPIVTVAIGYASGIPWFWIWLGALAAFAFISNGLLRFAEWRYSRQVQDKFLFHRVNMGRSIHGDGIVIGVEFYNKATFPIEFEIDQIRTRLGDKVPRQNKSRKPSKYVIPPDGVAWYYDYPIQIDPPSPGTVEGFLEYEIHYGRPSALSYNLVGKKQVIASFNDNGILTGAVWNDAV
jgi:hypothetical protein